MAKITQIGTPREAMHKRTKQGGRIVKTSSMNKDEKRSYKKPRGQGR